MYLLMHEQQREYCVLTTKLPETLSCCSQSFQNFSSIDTSGEYPNLSNIVEENFALLNRHHKSASIQQTWGTKYA